MVSAWQPSVGRGGSRPARGRSAGDRGVPRRAEEGGVAIGWSGLLATNDLIQARVVDDDVRRHGQHREGLFLSAFGVFSRLTGATAGLGLGSLGLLFGYYSGEDPGPDPGTAFRVAVSVYPFVIAVLGVVLSLLIRVPDAGTEAPEPAPADRGRDRTTDDVSARRSSGVPGSAPRRSPR